MDGGGVGIGPGGVGVGRGCLEGLGGWERGMTC